MRIPNTEITALSPAHRVLPPGKIWVPHRPKLEKRRPGVKTKLGFFYYN